MKVVYKVVQENAELQRACNTCTGIEASFNEAGWMRGQRRLEVRTEAARSASSL